MKLGIVAGGGALPVRLVKHCAENMIPYHVFPITGHAQPESYQYHPHDHFRLGAGGTFIKNLHKRDITDVVLIGALGRPTFWQLRPDLFTLSILPRLGLASRGDDGVLRALANIIEKAGRVKIRGIHEFLPDLLAPAGIFSQQQPSSLSKQAVLIGSEAALALGQADIGQAVIAGPDAVYDQEDRSGTDSLLRRFRETHKSDGVLVKLCKPQQDMRLDLPTIGTHTIENAAAAGIKGIVVSAGKTLITDLPATVDAADARGIFLQGINLP